VKKLKRSPYLDSAPLAMLPSTGSEFRRMYRDQVAEQEGD